VSPRHLGAADASAATAESTASLGDKPSLRLVRVERPHEPVPTLASFLPTARVLMARYGLSEREAGVALQVAEGARNREIAGQMGLSVHTVRRHVENLLKKLCVHNRSSVLPRLLTARFT
jgi:DNA-binding NarL/FixJ family response regulator